MPNPSNRCMTRSAKLTMLRGSITSFGSKSRPIANVVLPHRVTRYCVDITDRVGSNACAAADWEAVKLAGGADEIATMLRGYLRSSGLGAFDVAQIGAITTYPSVGGTTICENVGIVVRSICGEPGRMPWLHVTIG